jgi:hypothetical protein
VEVKLGGPHKYEMEKIIGYISTDSNYTPNENIQAPQMPREKSSTEE